MGSMNDMLLLMTLTSAKFTTKVNVSPTDYIDLSRISCCHRYFNCIALLDSWVELDHLSATILLNFCISKQSFAWNRNLVFMSLKVRGHGSPTKAIIDTHISTINGWWNCPVAPASWCWRPAPLADSGRSQLLARHGRGCLVKGCRLGCMVGISPLV